MICRLTQDPLDPYTMTVEVSAQASAANLARYVPRRLLGSGANGVALLVERLIDGAKFAAKIIPVSRVPVPPTLVYKLSAYRCLLLAACCWSFL